MQTFIRRGEFTLSERSMGEFYNKIKYMYKNRYIKNDQLEYLNVFAFLLRM